MEDGGVVVRRVIPADNSCLFNAVGYVMEHNREKAAELRKVIASAVSSDPETYSDAILGKDNQEYCRWILTPSKWGGAIELAILADHYQREIAAYDIQTKRCDVYGQGKAYKERVMLIYDGLHYDALAMAPFPDAPDEVDQTIFNVDKNGGIGAAGSLAEKLVDECHRARKFTDTGKFTLRCGICQMGVVGETGAAEHCKQTGHTRFEEYVAPKPRPS